MSSHAEAVAGPIYLDHAASSPLRPQARAAMARIDDLVGNPSALHGGGRRARALLEDARERLAGLIGAQPDEVIFTSGGSESNSIAVLQTAMARAEDRPGLVISSIEHPAVAGVGALLGDRVRVAQVEASGQVDIDAISGLIDDRVGLVSLTWVSNEVGTIQPVVQVARLARERGALFHTDAVQGLGHLPLDFSAMDADLLSLSAHKIGGPIGIGALLVRRGVSLPAYGLGGKQGGGVRSGTLPVVLAVGFAAAACAAVDDIDEASSRMAGWRQRLAAVTETLGGVVNGTAEQSPAIINLAFAGASADDLTFLLDQQRIWCSTGSACRAGVHGPSEVLLAMGRDDRAAREGVRVSFGWSTTDADIDRLVSALPDAVQRARQVPR